MVEHQWLRGQDSNLRFQAYEACEITGFSTPPCVADYCEHAVCKGDSFDFSSRKPLREMRRDDVTAQYRGSSPLALPAALRTFRKESTHRWSERRDSNPRHPAPKAGALPTGLRPDFLSLQGHILCSLWTGVIFYPSKA